MTFVRKVALAVCAGALALGAVSCSSDSDAETSAHDAVTVTHVMGETEIHGTPSRIVALGNQWLDAAEALGVEPVGYVDSASLVANGKPVPWEPESLRNVTKIVPGGDVAEQVAALNPDLILGPAYFIDKTRYDKLSALAPTISSLTSSEVDPWEDQLTVLGRVLQKDDKAKQVIDDLHARIDAVAAKYPGLKDKTFITCFLVSPTQLMVLADPKDGASALFTRLGMHLPQEFVDQAKGQSRLSLSPERLQDLQADLVVAGVMPGMEEPRKALPGYATLPSVQKNSFVTIDVLDAGALNTPSSLSVAYMLDKLEPTLANAAQ